MTTTVVIWMTVSAVVFAGATLVAFLTAGRTATPEPPVVGAGMVLGVISYCALRFAAPTTPLWVGLVTALVGAPVTLAGVNGWAALWPEPPEQPPPPPIGTCGRCGAELWDCAGKHRYTDHNSSYLCPPEHRHPGQPRLHQLATNVTGGPLTLGSGIGGTG